MDVQITPYRKFSSQLRAAVFLDLPAGKKPVDATTDWSVPTVARHTDRGRVDVHNIAVCCDINLKEVSLGAIKGHVTKRCQHSQDT